MDKYGRKLVKSARKGCVAAFEELIRPHQNRVFNFLLMASGNEFEANLLTQDVFVKVFESLTSDEIDDNYTAAIYRTAGEISRQTVRISKKIS